MEKQKQKYVGIGPRQTYWPLGLICLMRPADKDPNIYIAHETFGLWKR